MTAKCHMLILSWWTATEHSKSNFDGFQALAMVRLLVCQVISVTGFSVERQDSTDFSNVIKICTHTTVNEDLQTEMFHEENSI